MKHRSLARGHSTISHSATRNRWAAAAWASAACIGLAACHSSDSGGASGGGGGGGDGEPAATTWAKSYGGPTRDLAAAGRARPGGGFVFAGTWNSVGSGSGRITGFDRVGSEADLWVVTLDELGNVEWQRSYGVPSVLPPEQDHYTYAHLAAAIDAENDGESNGTWLVGQVSGGETVDLVITRLDAAGQPLWTRAYDSGPIPNWRYFFEDEQNAEAFDPHIVVTPDGGAVIAGRVKGTISVTTEPGASARAAVAHAIWILRVDAAGERHWAHFLDAGEGVANAPEGILVAPLPNRGAIVAYTVRNGNDEDPEDPKDQVRIARLDAGLQSATVRWQTSFDYDRPRYGTSTAQALLAVDDDSDGAVDAALAAGEAMTGDDRFGWVRKLDIDDGSETWHKTIGDMVSGAATACVPEPAGPNCHYVVLALDSGRGLVRTLALGSGNTIAEGRYSGIRPVVVAGGSAIRYVEEHNVYQLIGLCAAADCTGLSRIAHLNPEGGLNADFDVVFEYDIDVEVGWDGAFFDRWVDDAGGWYQYFSGRYQTLRQMTRFGRLSRTTTELSGIGVSVERGYAVAIPAAGPGASGSGYVVAGEVLVEDTSSAGRRRSAWLLRLQENGDIAWQKRLEGFSLSPFSISRTYDLVRSDLDGGIIVAGQEYTDLDDQNAQARVLKLDDDGRIEWLSKPLAPQELFDGYFHFSPTITAVDVTPQGDYFAGGRLGWLARLRRGGSIEWQYRYVVPSPTEQDAERVVSFDLTELQALDDGGALLIGRQYRTLPDAAEFWQSREAELDSFETIGPTMLVAVKLDADGAVEWGRSYMASLREHFPAPPRVVPVADGYVIAASTGDFVDPADYGRTDVLLLKLDTEGTIEWAQRYGGLFDEVAADIELLADGGFLVSAWSDSMGDYTEAWMLRVGPDGRIAEGCAADRGRAASVFSRPLEVLRLEVTPVTEAQPPSIVVHETSVIAREPTDVVVARQCLGTVSNDPGEAPPTHTLTVDLQGVETGVVTSMPAGIACGIAGGGTCSNVFPAGELVTLRVDLGAPNWTWGPGCSTVSADLETCIVEVDADKTITITFGATVDLTIGGIIGFGTVTSVPPGLSCPEVCTAPFAEQAVVTLTANPDDGWLFIRWEGDCAGTALDVTVTMDAEHSCGARFERIEEQSTPPSAAFTYAPPNPDVNETVIFDASGSSDDEQIVSYEWDFTDDGVFDASGVQTEFVYAQAGSFTARLKVTDGDGLTDETTQTVTVQQPGGGDGTFTLTLDITGNGRGVVTYSVDGVMACSKDQPVDVHCERDFDEGTGVFLTATVYEGSAMGEPGWTGDCEDIDGNLCLVGMGGDRSVALEIIAPQ